MPFHPAKAAARAQYRVLVADDTPATRSVFQSFPSTEILVCGIVTDRAGLSNALAKFADIDAILCADHLAGTFGGVHALTELRARDALPHSTAFILMSADARKSNLMANIEARPDGILLKPFAPSMLLAKLDTVVAARRALAPLRELAGQQSWAEVLRLATELLETGTRYPVAVEKLKLEACGRLGDPVAQRATYERMLAQKPNSPAALEALARLLYDEYDFNGAERALTLLLVLQPANIRAMDAMVDVRLAKSDRVGAQQQLQLAVRHAPHSVERHRVLAHVALLNGDTPTAQRAYMVAMRQQAQASGTLDEVDVINAVRAHILNGATHNAWQAVTDARKCRPDSLALDVLERLVAAVMCRSFDSFGDTQYRLAEAIGVLGRPIVQNNGPLKLAAIEASLIALLAHRAYLMSKELTSGAVDTKLHPLQLCWARKLEKWAIDVKGEVLPKGMQDFHKFMR